jgi:hypothetical protein
MLFLHKITAVFKASNRSLIPGKGRNIPHATTSNLRSNGHRGLLKCQLWGRNVIKRTHITLVRRPPILYGVVHPQFFCSTVWYLSRAVTSLLNVSLQKDKGKCLMYLWNTPYNHLDKATCIPHFGTRWKQVTGSRLYSIEWDRKMVMNGDLVMALKSGIQAEFKVLSRIWVTWLIIIASGLDESIYWALTSRKYNGVTDFHTTNHSTPIYSVYFQ